MIQLFLQPSRITSAEWSIAYKYIKRVVEAFPLRLVRIEAYNDYSPQLDKIHFDVVVGEGTAEEHIFIWGDWLSHTGSISVRFYKDLAAQLANHSALKEIDATKPITWYPNEPYLNDGTIAPANGVAIPARYIDTEGAHYESALLAIGMLLEKLLPTKAFMKAERLYVSDIEKVREWLEYLLEEPFELPIFFDKKRLLDSFVNAYATKKEAACRIAHLFREQHKRNMEFSLAQLGYSATFDLYADILATTTFGTFGFWDVLNPWIAATKDLESTLNLVAMSKQQLLEAKDNSYSLKNAAKYDLTRILKELLGNYVLWTPQQRESLDHFYTNKEALETGDEDLFGVMKRMMGFRADICPIYASEEELFEAFMYHDPKNGATFKQIIEDWKLKNMDAYTNFKQKLETHLQESEERAVTSESVASPSKLEAAVKLEADIKHFLTSYAPEAQFFVRKAIASNPNVVDIASAIRTMQNRVASVITSDEHSDYVKRVRTFSKEQHIRFIRSRIKELSYTVHPEFEKWLEEEDNKQVFFYLHFLMALKLYDQPTFFARFCLLWYKKHWDEWR